MSISEFLETRIPLQLVRIGRGLYYMNGDIVVDRICLFENIVEELEQVFPRLRVARKI